MNTYIYFDENMNPIRHCGLLDDDAAFRQTTELSRTLNIKIMCFKLIDVCVPSIRLEVSITKAEL